MDAADQKETESPEDELWDLFTSHRDDATPALFLTLLLSCDTIPVHVLWSISNLGNHRSIPVEQIGLEPWRLQQTSKPKQTNTEGAKDYQQDSWFGRAAGHQEH